MSANASVTIIFSVLCGGWAITRIVDAVAEHRERMAAIRRGLDPDRKQP